MQNLNFPSYPFRVKTKNQQQLIFDSFRKKWFVLTPEEWVRQHLLSFLHIEKKYPKSLISVEKTVKVNQLSQRYDAVIFSPNTSPLVIIECKAPNVPITEDTISQILRYNAVIQAPYLIISNGIDTICGYINFATRSFSYLKNIPDYTDIK